jgi:hypothetical protein
MGCVYFIAFLCLCWAAYAVVQAAGRYVDRRHAARRKHEAMLRDVRAAQVYREAWLVAWDEQRDLTAWECELQDGMPS